MTRIRYVRRLIAGLAGALLAFAGAAPAALARSAPPRPPGWNKHPPLPVQVRTVVTGGMAGWQIALIAAGAALVVAAAAVAVYRAGAIGRRSRRHQPLRGGDPA